MELSPATMAASQMQMMQTDQMNAMTIQQQMAAESTKQQMRGWQIKNDTVTKTFEIEQEVTVNKAKTSDKMWQKWDQYIQS
jgi:hypothetical protein